MKKLGHTVIEILRHAEVQLQTLRNDGIQTSRHADIKRACRHI